MSPEHIDALAIAWQANPTPANAGRVWCAVRHVVVKLAMQRRPCAETDDLISVGAFAVLQSLRSWRHGVGMSFKSYSAFAARGRMNRLINTERYQRAMAFHGEKIALDDGEPFGPDCLPGSEPMPDECASARELSALVDAMGSQFKPRQWAVVQGRIAGRVNRSIAADLGITYQAVHQIDKKCLPEVRQQVLDAIGGAR